MNNNSEKIRQVIRDSNNIVLIGGSEMIKETGLYGVRAEDITYDVEEKYGFSPEEIVTSAYFSRQVENFYDYYKNIILNKKQEKPTLSFDAVAELDKQGKLSAVVTRTVYKLFQKAGCRNVIELYGSVEENECPRCGKIFDSEYIKRSKDVPTCDNCGVIIRPGFSFFGEMMDNGKITSATNAIENADVLLVVGTSLNSATWQNMLRYYKGNKLILVNTVQKRGDSKADYREYGNIGEILNYIIR